MRALEIEGVQEQDRPLTLLESQFDELFARARENGSYGNFAQAATDYTEALYVAREFGEEDARLFETLSRLAYCRYRLGDLRSAEETYREALSLIERFHKDTHPERLASVLWALAVLYSDSLRFEDAENYFHRSMDVTEAWAGPNDRFIADCLWGLSKCLTSMGKLTEARTAIKKAIAIYESMPDNCDEYLCTNYGNLGNLELQMSKLDEAVPHLARAIELRTRIAGEVDLALVGLANKISLALIQLGKHKEAEKYLKLGLKVTNANFGEKSLESARKMIALGNCLNHQAKYAQAEKTLTKAAAIVRKQSVEPAITAACLYELNTSLQKLDDKGRTRKVLEELSDLYEHSNLPKQALYADARLKLGTIYEEVCLYKKAKSCFESALEARRSVFGEEHKLIAECLMRLAGCLNRLGEGKEAGQIQRQAENMLNDLKHRA